MCRAPRLRSRGVSPRASAAIEEARIDKTVAIDEDSGWKNRISFPAKKKEAARQEDADDAAVYNPVNKDLRTVVEYKRAETPHAPKAEEERVDLGALAAVGLPKDVTPEEIAALAAAAAQVKGITDDKVEHTAPPVAPAMTESSVAAAAAEEKAQEKIEAKVEEEAKIEAAKIDAEKIEPQKIDAEEKIETKEADLLTHAIPADVMAAIANLEVESESELAGAEGSGNGAWSQAGLTSADEPVTMALATVGESQRTHITVDRGFRRTGSRSTSISLEQEMQKAHAAFAAAEANQPAMVSTTSDMPPAAEAKAATASSTPFTSTPFTVESRIAEPVAEVAATVAPEPAQTLSLEASVEASGAPEAVTAAAKGLEAVPAEHAEQSSAAEAALSNRFAGIVSAACIEQFSGSRRRESGRRIRRSGQDGGSGSNRTAC